MWIKSENSEPIRPLDVEVTEDVVFVRRNIVFVETTDEKPEHYKYDEWQMTIEQYDVYKTFEESINEQSDALIELAGLISEVLE